MRRTTSVLVAVGLAVVGAAVIAGLYLGGFWVAKDATNRQYQVNVNTQQYQAGLIAQERDRVQGIETSNDEGQKKNLALTFCTVYHDLTVQPEDLALAFSTYCN